MTTKPIMTAAACDHFYAYQGRYGKVNHSPLPGTGALRVEVFDVYYCQYCLHQERVPTHLVGYQTYGAKPWEGEWIA